VVLLVRHGRTGSSGFIINRPTQFDVGDVTKKLSHFESNPLYLGGDVGEGVYMIHGVNGLKNATEVSDGIFYGGSDEVDAFVEAGKAMPEDFRFFFKYTAWAPGQLEAEINAGCWCPVKTSLDLVLQRRDYSGLHYSKHHKVFWHQVQPPVRRRAVAPSACSRSGAGLSADWGRLTACAADPAAARGTVCQHLARYDRAGGAGAAQGGGVDGGAAGRGQPGAPRPTTTMEGARAGCRGRKQGGGDLFRHLGRRAHGGGVEDGICLSRSHVSCVGLAFCRLVAPLPRHPCLTAPAGFRELQTSRFRRRRLRSALLARASRADRYRGAGDGVERRETEREKERERETERESESEKGRERERRGVGVPLTWYGRGVRGRR
jgi:putative transcriptional regulator